MKCPQCNYVSFDGVPRCKKCGFQFKRGGDRQEALDVKSLISEANLKGGGISGGSEPSGLKKAVSSIRESLKEIEGQGGKEQGSLQEQSLTIDTDELKFRVDSSYIDTAKQFPDHNEINWEESVSLSNHELTLPLDDDGAEYAEQEFLAGKEDNPHTVTERLRSELRQMSEELKEIDEIPVPTPPAGAVGSYPPEDALRSAAKGGFWIRAVAYLIDTAILYILAIILAAVGVIALGIASSSDLRELDEERIMGLLGPLYLFNTVITVFYFTYFHGSVGQTPGKMLCRLKVVRVNGDALGYGRAFLRWVGYLPSSFIFCLGFIWAALDKHKQAWHDKIAGTYVIRT